MTASPPPEVNPADEAAHTPGPEPLWNESWYWDFADEQQGIGGWIRLGLMPNERVAWINAMVCGPAMPTVALLDFHAPLPADPNHVRGAGVEMRHHATEALREYRVAVSGVARRYGDPAAVLRGEAGEPAQLAMDLGWTTVGAPEASGQTPRGSAAAVARSSVVIMVVALSLRP